MTLARFHASMRIVRFFDQHCKRQSNPMFDHAVAALTAKAVDARGSSMVGMAAREMQEWRDDDAQVLPVLWKHVQAIDGGIHHHPDIHRRAWAPRPAPPLARRCRHWRAPSAAPRDPTRMTCPVQTPQTHPQTRPQTHPQSHPPPPHRARRHRPPLRARSATFSWAAGSTGGGTPPTGRRVEAAHGGGFWQHPEHCRQRRPVAARPWCTVCFLGSAPRYECVLIIGVDTRVMH